MTTRPLVLGPDSGPEPPYPLRMEGKVIAGFGRGSKELGIPTANLPVDEHPDANAWISDIASGVYFGWASIALPATHPNSTAAADQAHPTKKDNNGFQIFPMVMSIGYNPFYKNTVRSAEVHVLHAFAADFYGAEMRLLIAGFIRNEKDYAGLEALIEDINIDCDVARKSLAREGWTPREGVVGGGVAGTLDGSWLVRPSAGGEAAE